MGHSVIQMQSHQLKLLICMFSDVVASLINCWIQCREESRALRGETREFETTKYADQWQRNAFQVVWWVSIDVCLLCSVPVGSPLESIVVTESPKTLNRCHLETSQGFFPSLHVVHTTIWLNSWEHTKDRDKDKDNTVRHQVISVLKCDRPGSVGIL